MSRTRRFRSFAFALIAASLAACGPHAQTAMLPAGQTGSNSASSLQTAPATFVFTVPKSVTSRSRSVSSTRTPTYVSSATKSISIAITDVKNAGNNQDITPGTLPAALVVNVPNGTGSAPGSPCVTDPAHAGNYQCTATDSLYVGKDSVTIKTWDASGGSGNVLSEFQPVVTVVQGIANTFTISLDANAATISVNGTAPCTSGGTIGASYGSVGTSPATFTVSYTDPAGKTIVSPGQPTLAVSTSGVSGGTLTVSVNQSTQTFTVTPSATGVSGTVNVGATPPNAGDGLNYNQTKSFTFTSAAAPGANFLAAVEQIGTGSGEIDLYNLTLTAGGPDTFNAASPAKLAITNSQNENKPDVDNPLAAVFDSSGDLLIDNGGSTIGGDYGDLACVPAGAIVTSANASTTTSSDVNSPLGGIAYDSRDNSVALGNTPGGTSGGYDFVEFLLSGDYTLAPSSRDVSSTLASEAVVAVPALPAGSYAVALTNGTDNHNGGTSKVTLVNSDGTKTDISSAQIDLPSGLAWDNQNQQLVVSNQSLFTGPGADLAFYTVTGTPTLVKTIDPGAASGYPAYTAVAASPDGHIAAAYFSYTPEFQIQVYDNTSNRNPVGGPIPYNGTSTPNGNYIYDTGSVGSGPGGSEKIYAMQWLSNTKLIVAFHTSASGKMGYYIYDISTLVVPSGYDDNSGNTFAAAPKQTGFQLTAGSGTYSPLSFAYKP